MRIQINRMENFDEFYSSTQDDGWCGYLAIVQANTSCDKLLLQNYRDRKFLIDKMESYLDGNHLGIDEADVFFRAIVEELKTWGILDLKKPKSVGSESGLWLPSDQIPSGLLQDVFKMHLWTLPEKHLWFESNGSNDGIMENSYIRWKDEIFSDSYSHLYYAKKHYFHCHAYSSTFLRQNLENATDELVKNIVAFLYN